MSFEAFKNEFKGDIVTPKDKGYAEAIARWARNAEKPAAIVAFARDATDVSLAVRYAVSANLDLGLLDARRGESVPRGPRHPLAAVDLVPSIERGRQQRTSPMGRRRPAAGEGAVRRHRRRRPVAG